MSYLIITEHFEIIEKGFFQADMKHLGQEKKNVYHREQISLKEDPIHGGS